MTALYFAHLRAPDRVSVKPHASPVLHAINYLLGRLDREYLTTLRAFGGLQCYPSRTKDPDPVDFSTGSVGIGATATIWSALAHRYVAGHFDVPDGGRQIALVGDAELDEGAIWEALVDPMVAAARRGAVGRRPQPPVAGPRRAGHRGGADRGDVRGGRLADDHRQVRPRLRELFARLDGGLRARIDEMTNEEYQRLLRADAAELRERLPGGRGRRAAACSTTSRRRAAPRSATSAATTSATCSTPSAPPTPCATARPSSSPTRSRPGGCRPRATRRTTRRCCRRAVGASWPPSSAPIPATRGRRSRRARPRPSCARRRRRGCAASRVAPREPPAVPAELGATHRGAASTQQAFGRFFVDLAREAPEVAARVVTVSARTSRRPRTSAAGSTAPASGTSATGSTGSPTTPTRSCAGARADHGQHIELGIAEVNLVGLLGELGATWSRDGQPLLPIGHDLRPVRRPRARAVVVRDLRRRAVDPRRHAVGRHARARGRRAPVGHHAVDRARAAGLRRVGAGVRAGPRVDVPARAVAARPARTGSSAYFRLSTRPIDQALAAAIRRAPPRRCWPAATGCARARGVVTSRRWAWSCPRCSRRPRSSDASRRLPDLRRPRLPRLPGARRPRRRRRRRSSTSCSRTAAADRLRCSTATRTR